MSSKERSWMVSLSAGELAVRYFKCRDRLAHAIGFNCESGFTPLLESVEGDESEPWPASPPMQEMVEESFVPGASPVLLGVGLSGNGHWSTAVEAKNGNQLKFDIACKNSKSSTSFGSEYRFVSGFALEPSTPKADKKLVLSLDSESGLAKIEIDASIGLLNLDIAGQRLRISPVTDSRSLLTHRWCYELCLVSAFRRAFRRALFGP